MRGYKILFLAVFATVLFSALTSAYFSPRDFSERIINSWVDFLEPALQALLGGNSWNGLYLFEKLLIFSLLICIIYLAVGQIPMFKEQKKATWVVSIIIPLIAVRFMDYDWISTILFQYQVLGIAVGSILPFIIYFFFVQGVGDQPTLRKILWIFFLIVYLGIWATSTDKTYAEIYAYTAIAAGLMLFFDGTINRYMLKQRMKAAGNSTVWDRIAFLNRDLEAVRNTPGLPADVKAKMEKERIKELERLRKHL